MSFQSLRRMCFLAGAFGSGALATIAACNKSNPGVEPVESSATALAPPSSSSDGASPPGVPPGSSTTAGALPAGWSNCVPRPERMWGDLSAVSVAAPAEDHPFELALPQGITRPPPPRGKPPEGCAPVEGLSRLATPGRELYSCCEQNRQPSPDSFTRGCMLPFACHYVDEAGGRAASLAELRKLVGPIDGEGKALGLLSLIYPEILDPFWFEQSKGAPYGMKALPEAPTPFAIERTARGFTIRLPMAATCGCTHHVLRIAFHVSRDGCVARLPEPPVPLAYSHGLCVD